MAAPEISSVTPSAGAPGTAIVVLGSGFGQGAQIACPVVVETTYVDAGRLEAEIPRALVGPAGKPLVVAVWVVNEDGSESSALAFTVKFPASRLQCFATVEAVVEEIPGFKRGGRVKDATIEVWMRSTAQAIAGAMARRGLSLDPADWQQAGTDAMPSPAGLLEMINRLGAAARLAAAIGGEFGQGEWSLAKALQRDYERELKALRDGEYDKLFRPDAATVETGQQVSVGDIETAEGEPERAFSKSKVF